MSVYAFGDARFAGDAPVGAAGGGHQLRRRRATGWPADDGGVFAFGGARFFGSLAGRHSTGRSSACRSTVTAIVTVASDGGVFTFGGAGFYGSLGGSTVRSAAGRPRSSAGRRDHRLPAWPRGTGSTCARRAGTWNVDGLGVQRRARIQPCQLGPVQHVRVSRPTPPTPPPISRSGWPWPSPPATGAIPNAAPDQHGCAGGY